MMSSRGRRSSGLSSIRLARSKKARIAITCSLTVRNSNLAFRNPNSEFRIRSAFRTPRSELNSFHDEVPLHLLVERRAEVRAVVREHALLLCRERHGLGLARIDDDIDVVVE